MSESRTDYMVPDTLKSSSELPMGYRVAEGTTSFRVFSPLAKAMEVHCFKEFDGDPELILPLQNTNDGNWIGSVDEDLTHYWYAYRILPPDEERPDFMPTDHLIADPWSRHVTSYNHYLQFPKTHILPSGEFDWENDEFQSPEDLRDLVIYEAHIKDMVAHPSARTYVQGIYNDFRQAEVGGISHLKRLGVNAVEFLPLHKFNHIEPPFNEETEQGIKNTWNPYSRNYWGYMTSFFLAPETLYASDGSLEENAVIGQEPKARNELKELVKALHHEGISVIMDVVYNHASHYDLNPLKYLAKDHYFKLDEIGGFINDSWTGNDINTSSEYARRLIVESVVHWMKEYHIDGFRFDLAGIIDWETVDLIREEARKINPNVILIAEPWGGEYKPDGFSDRGWSAWNDRIRNGFKGYDPVQDRGFIFGGWSGGSSRYGIENFIRGTLKGRDHGLFNTSAHSVNYIESHDGYTFGDYIRIALNPENADKTFTDKLRLSSLSDKEMAHARFGALALFVSQGITMIHAGQEWARAKMIVDPSGKDPNAGKLDRDSYNKDNETNWLNFNEIEVNRSLFEYYQGLIAFRLSSPAVRKAKPDEIEFKVYEDPLHVTFSICTDMRDDPYDYFISLNGNPDKKHKITLPEGYWEVIIDHETASNETKTSVRDMYIVPPTSGIVLRKLRVSKS